MTDQVGSLIVSLAADLVRFDADMKKAQSIAAGAMGKIESAAAAATKALGAIGVGLSVAGLAGIVKESIQAAAALDDLATVTGTTVEQLSKFDRIARLTGAGSLDEISGALQRLTKSMVDSDEASSDAAAAFKALGISTRDSSGQLKNSGAVLEDVARELAKYEDGATKVAVAQALLGRSGAALLPYLQELAENSGVLGRVTAEQAAEAEKLDKEFRKLRDTFDGFANSIASVVAPALTELLQQFRDGIEIAGGFGKAMLQLGVALSPGTTLDQVNADLAKMRQRLDEIAKYPWPEFLRNAAAGPVRDAIATLEKQQEFLRRQADRQFAAGYRDFKYDSVPAAVLRFTPPTTGSRGKTQDPRLEALIRRGNELERLQQEAERELKDSTASRLQIEKEREQVLERNLQQARDESAAIKAIIADRDKTLDSIEASTRAIELETLLVGESAEHRAKALATLQATEDINRALALGEDEVAAALMEQLRARNALIDAQAEQPRKTKEQEKAEREAQRLIEEQQRAAERLQDTITDGLMRAFESGKDAAQSFRDTLVNIFKTMVLRPSIEYIVKGAMGGVGFGAPGAANANGPGSFDLTRLGGLFGPNGVGGIGTMAGSVAGNIAGFFGGDALATAATVSSIAGTIGTVIPWVGIALAAASALGAFDRGGPKVGAFAQTDNLNLDPFFGGGDNRPLEQLVTGTQASYRNIVAGFGGRPGDFAFALGYDTDPEGEAPNRISAGASVDGINVVERISEDIGRDQARLEEEIAATVGDALKGAILASDIPEAAKDLIREFDGTAQEIEAFAIKLAGVSSLLRTTNVGIQQLIAGMDIATLEDFTDAFGGVEGTVAALTAYMQEFYSESERATIATESLIGEFAKFGGELPATREIFRGMVETAIKLGDEQLLANLLRLAPAVDAMFDGVEGLNAAVEEFRDNATALAYEDYWTEQRRLAEERRQLFEEEARRRADAREDLQGFLGSLFTDGSLSPLNPAEQLEIAKQQYLAALQTGEDTAGKAQAYLGLARDYYGSSAGYNAIFGAVTQGIAAAATPPGQSAPQTLEEILAALNRWALVNASGQESVVEAVNEGARAMVTAIRTSRFTDRL